MWLYVAEGSGVSLNVGRSVAVSSYWEAVNMLERYFPGNTSAARCGCGGEREAAKSGRATMAATARRPARATSGAELGSPSPQISPPGGQIGAPKLARREEFDLGAISPDIDTIQILQHQEYFSRESRHEIISLAHRECAALHPGTPRVMCGREPFLRRCDPSSRPLLAMRRCKGYRQRTFSAEVASDVVTLSRFAEGSKCSSSRCFGYLGSSEQFCPRPSSV